MDLKLKPELINHESMYELLSDDEGNLYLDVVCGGVGMYGVTIRLTPEQVTQYRDEGLEYLTDVAHRVKKGELKEQKVTR